MNTWGSKSWRQSLSSTSEIWRRLKIERSWLYRTKSAHRTPKLSLPLKRRVKVHWQVLPWLDRWNFPEYSRWKVMQLNKIMTYFSIQSRKEVLRCQVKVRSTSVACYLKPRGMSLVARSRRYRRIKTRSKKMMTAVNRVSKSATAMTLMRAQIMTHPFSRLPITPHSTPKRRVLQILQKTR